MTPPRPVHRLCPRLAFGKPECQNGRVGTSPIEIRALRQPATSTHMLARPVLKGVGPEETGFMKIRPLQDRILVKRIAEEETTKGGIIIPDSAKEKPQEGKIVAVGKGKVSEDGKVTPLDVKKGDKILFSKYAGTEVNIEGEEHLIIREDDVLGVVE